ncbi:hypothetical protein LSTR_LSTR008994 [Laodelphax striatellus]|uniref:Uncharacterized protein n=1 Tax=Laodelphax striatellus TaxID=195883 RepID=A0A482WYL2_LAOST|nr:hypothetical protein LSTR_LSTR008994 [Laodelphax striatellus]
MAVAWLKQDKTNETFVRSSLSPWGLDQFVMSNQEEGPSSSGVADYRNRLRAKNNVDYSYKKRKIRYSNPFAKVVQDKKSKSYNVTTTKNVNHSSSKRKMNYINPYAVGSKKKKVEAYQSRSRNNANESGNEIPSSFSDNPIKKEEDLPYNFRSRKTVNYSLTKVRAKFTVPSTKQLKTDKEDFPVKSEPDTDDAESSSEKDNILMKTVVSEVDEKPIKTTLNEWAHNNNADDSLSGKVIEIGLTENGVIQVENHFKSEKSDELVHMKSPTLKIKAESLEDSGKNVLKPIVSEHTSNIHFAVDEPVEEVSDDVQFIPKPVQIITIDDDDDEETDVRPCSVLSSCADDEVAKSEINSEVIHYLDSCEKTETEIALDEMPQSVTEIDLLSSAKSEPFEPKFGSNEFVTKDEWKHIDWLKEISNLTDSLEFLFRDRNTLEEPNFNFLNWNYLIRCAMEIENKYRQFEFYTFEGLDREVGGIEQLTEEQLEHPYYKNYHPEPELSEDEKEQIELEKDRICEEASGFNNHLWRRPLNGGPFAQTNIPIPKCPEFIHAFTPAGQHVAMKTDADRPPKFRTAWDRRLWDFATIFNFNRYRDDIEEGHYLPASADPELESSVLRLDGTLRTYMNRNRRELLPFEKMLLLNEMKLLYWDKCIKNCLPELENVALCLLDEIIEAPVYVFTMIKFVFIFVTIKKVMLQKRYPALRSKATLLYEKIKENAILREGESLEEHIFPRSRLLHQHYEGACVFDFIRLNARTATKTIINKLIDIVKGPEEDNQVDESQEAEVDGENAIDDDDADDEDDDDEGSDSDEGDDDEDDDDDSDDGYSGTYDEVGSSSSSSFDSDSDHDDFYFDGEDSDDASSSSSSSEDEALMDDIIREE